MLRLFNRRQVSVKVLAEKVSRRNFATRLQRRRSNLWADFHIEDEISSKLLLKSDLSKVDVSKSSSNSSRC